MIVIYKNICLQLVLFANSKFTVTDFLHANKKTFIELFVIDAEKPAFSNPLPSPIRLIYTNDQLYEQLNYTAFQVSQSVSQSHIIICIYMSYFLLYTVHFFPYAVIGLFHQLDQC